MSTKLRNKGERGGRERGINLWRYQMVRRKQEGHTIVKDDGRSEGDLKETLQPAGGKQTAALPKDWKQGKQLLLRVRKAIYKPLKISKTEALVLYEFIIIYIIYYNEVFVSPRHKTM